ncbi:MAG: hypothetical protein ABSD02_06325 [Steroidobacteraceae bacterium]|jgi:hypothetical protein
MTYRDERTRIGGEFELDLNWFAQTADKAPLTLPCAHLYWTDTGRSALFLLAIDILRRGGEPLVWIPAFCCRSVVQAFQQAGFSIRYFSSAELHGGAGPGPRPCAGQTVLFVHYFGHINRYRLAQVADWRRIGAFVIEDAAQAALTQGVGLAGHYAITSLRKFVPQPDGAMIGSEFELTFSTTDPDEEFVSARILAKLMRGAGASPECFLPLLAHTESRLDTEAIVPRRPSWIGRLLMARTDFPSVAERRRVNWESLRESLRGSLSSHLTALHEVVEGGEVPLGLAVRVGGGQRESLRRYLADHSIFCPVHWPLAHVPMSTDLALDHDLASQILTLPIDQRMEESHVRRFVTLLKRFVKAIF